MLKSFVRASVFALALSVAPGSAVMASPVDGQVQQIGDGRWWFTYDSETLQVLSITSSNDTQRAGSRLVLNFLDPVTVSVVLTIERPAAPGSVTTNLRNNNPQIFAVLTSKGYVVLPFFIEGGWG